MRVPGKRLESLEYAHFRLLLTDFVYTLREQLRSIHGKGKYVFNREIQSKLSSLTLRGLKANADFYDFLSLPVISTGRSFAYYRKIFFGNRSQRDVLATLVGKRIVDS